MKFILLLLVSSLVACDCSREHLTQVPSSSDYVAGIVGEPGQQTPVYRDSLGNSLGYYEYLPVDYKHHTSQLPLIFYWNGSNAITGNGQGELSNLLTQGLPQYINQGKTYPAIIISAMMPDWKKNDIHPFVDYILRKYQGEYNPQKIYMTGFSAGGGLTIRYAARYPEILAAIVPIAPAVLKPKLGQPSDAMADLPSWMFHNKGDKKVEAWRSEIWHNALLKKGGDHRLTLNDSDSHYAWQSTYDNPDMWHWLFSKSSLYKGIHFKGES